MVQADRAAENGTRQVGIDIGLATQQFIFRKKERRTELLVQGQSARDEESTGKEVKEVY